MLGLIHEGEAVAAMALDSFGIELEGARAAVDKIMVRGKDAPKSHIPFTPRAKKILEDSPQEALALGHNYIGTEHILLALLGQDGGAAEKVLEKLGADRDAIRQKVLELLGGMVHDEVPAQEPMGSRLYTVTVDAKDPRGLAEFWEQVLHYERTEESGPDADEVEIVISPKDGKGNDILFVEASDEKVGKNRIHFDLNPTDQAAEVERILALGATKVDIGQKDVTWTVLADPEGKEFCILRAR